jgi:hypothetical protein
VVAFDPIHRVEERGWKSVCRICTLVTRDPFGEPRFVAVEPSGPVPTAPEGPLSGDMPVADLPAHLRAVGAPVRFRVAGFGVTLRLAEIPAAVPHG